MLAILISVRSEWCEKTINGLKITEIRKGTALFKAINKLIEKQGVAPVFIYCTKDKKMPLVRDIDGSIVLANEHYAYCDEELNGKVIAKYNATAEEINPKDIWQSCSSNPFDIQNYEECELCKNSCLSFVELDNYLCGEKGTAVHIHDLQVFDKPKELSEFKVKHYPQYAGFVKNKTHYELVPLTRAPQSWFYIEI